ncbi:MAG TPA: hypothetical protein VGJ73_12085, partial [Verrucomicrobiae bacterium]
MIFKQNRVKNPNESQSEHVGRKSPISRLRPHASTLQRFNALTCVALLFTGCQTHPKQNGKATAPKLTTTPQAVLNVMQSVADWQLTHPSAHKPTDWTCAAGDAGFMALAGISG